MMLHVVGLVIGDKLACGCRSWILQQHGVASLKDWNCQVILSRRIIDDGNSVYDESYGLVEGVFRLEVLRFTNGMLENFEPYIMP